MTKLDVIPIGDLQPFGEGAQRPEDVVVSRDGRAFLSGEAEIVEVLDDGTLRTAGVVGGTANGINMTADGKIVATDFSERGGVRLLDPASGEVTVLADAVDGRPLRFTNYPVIDSRGSIWVSVSTQVDVWLMSIVNGTRDGFIVRIDPDGTTGIVADGIPFTNGMALDADEAYLYVCRTAPGDVVRYRINDDRSLAHAEPYGPPMGQRATDEYGEEVGLAALADPEVQRRWGLTDGCGFDQEGNLWVTVVTTGRINVITPAQDVVTVIDDPDGKAVLMPTNVTWGGPDLRDLYIGSIGLNHVLKVRSPIPGLPLVHQR